MPFRHVFEPYHPCKCSPVESGFEPTTFLTCAESRLSTSRFYKPLKQEPSTMVSVNKSLGQLVGWVGLACLVGFIPLKHQILPDNNALGEDFWCLPQDLDVLNEDLSSLCLRVTWTKWPRSILLKLRTRHHHYYHVIFLKTIIPLDRIHKIFFFSISRSLPQLLGIAWPRWMTPSRASWAWPRPWSASSARSCAAARSRGAVGEIGF